MKTWARERFGVEVGYHEGKHGAAANSAALKDAQDYANYRGVPMDRMFTFESVPQNGQKPQ
jgi:hypothetical protein